MSRRVERSGAPSATLFAIGWHILPLAAQEGEVHGETEGDAGDEWDAGPHWADAKVEEKGWDPGLPRHTAVLEEVGTVLA